MKSSAWLIAAIVFGGCGDSGSNDSQPTPNETTIPDPAPTPDPTPTDEPIKTPIVCSDPETVEAVTSTEEFEAPTRFWEPLWGNFPETWDEQVITILRPAGTVGYKVSKLKESDLVLDIQRQIGTRREAHAVQYFFLLDNKPIETTVRVWNRSRTVIETEVQGSTYDTGVLDPGARLAFEVVIPAESMPESRFYDLVIVTRDMDRDIYSSDFASHYAVANESYDLPAFDCFLPSYNAYRNEMPLNSAEQAIENARRPLNVFRHLQIYLDDAPADFVDARRVVDVTGKQTLKVNIVGYPISGERGFIPETLFPVLNDQILEDRFDVAFAGIAPLNVSGTPGQNGPWPGSTGGANYDEMPFIPVWRGEFEVELPDVASTDLQLFAARWPHSSVGSYDVDGSNVIRLVRTDASQP